VPFSTMLTTDTFLISTIGVCLKVLVLDFKLKYL